MKFYSVKESAALAGLKGNSVRAAIKTGRLRA
jgi:hypothetical protein